MRNIFEKTFVGAMVLLLIIPIAAPFIVTAKPVEAAGGFLLFLCLSYALGRWLTRGDQTSAVSAKLKGTDND